MTPPLTFPIGSGLLLSLACALLTAILIVMMRPLMRRYAMARPNARSSHHEPTPQGGGFGVVAVTLALTPAAVAILLGSDAVLALVPVFAATILLTVIGAIDDVFVIQAWPRLFWQAVAVAIVIVLLPANLHIFPQLPLWTERLLLVLAGIWFVNLVNFMDGIDWMTVAEFVPVLGALIVFGLLGLLPLHATLLAFALVGGMLGFAPFNRPVAKLFLGDIGSLPLGLLLGWLLVQLAGTGNVVAALILPLYYLADTTVTLLRRLAAGEHIMQAHRSHFYQRACSNGFSVMQVAARTFVLNVALALLAFATLATAGATSLALLVLGAVLVGGQLYIFTRRRGQRDWKPSL